MKPSQVIDLKRGSIERPPVRSAVGDQDESHTRPRALFLVKLLRVLEYVFLVAMLALVWDLRADPTYVWCVLLAAIPALSSFVAPFRLPLLLVYLVLERVHRALRERHGIDRSAEFVRAEREGEARVTAGNQSIAALTADGPTDASIRHRVAALVRLLYLPLLVVYWLG